MDPAVTELLSYRIAAVEYDLTNDESLNGIGRPWAPLTAHFKMAKFSRGAHNHLPAPLVDPRRRAQMGPIGPRPGMTYLEEMKMAAYTIKPLVTATAINTGGRNGHSETTDHSVNVD